MELTKKSAVQETDPEKYSRLIESNSPKSTETPNTPIFQEQKDEAEKTNTTSPKSPKTKPKDPKDVDLAAIGKKMSSEKKKLSFKRLMQQSKPVRHLLLLGVIFTFFGAISYLATPVLMGAIIDSISTSPDNLKGPVLIFCELSPFGCKKAEDVLSTALMSLMVIALITAVFSFGKWYSLEVAGERVVAKLRTTLFFNVLEQEIGMFDVTETGEIVSRLSNDAAVIKWVCTGQVAQTIQSMMSVTLSIIYVLYLSWDLTLVMLSIVPIVVVLARFYGNYYRKLSKENQAVLAQATQVATESISLVRTVKSFSKEDSQCKKYDESIDLTYQQGIKMARANGIWMGIFTIIANAGIGGVLWYGSTKVLKGKMNAGELTTYVILTIQIGFYFSSFISLYSTVMKALGASERVFELIDRKSKIPSQGGIKLNNNVTNSLVSIDNHSSTDYSKSTQINGHVKLNNVVFSYPSRPNVTVLNSLSLEVPPGKITALVGESGGGKSTVAKLVMRFYDTDSGSITIDDRLIQTYDLRWLHTQIGFVSQEPVLFGTTIRENIIYGLRNEVKESELISAAKTANAHKFISEFPDGYETVVGERGIRLSGGQKQRVAIARAILMDPKILLLDEATSALDSESEYYVQQALDRVMVGRSVLVIAHRLSTVKSAHQVVVIEKGKLVECGTHDELIEKSGVYAKLVGRQLLGS